MNSIESQLYGAFQRMESKAKTVLFEVQYTTATAVVTQSVIGSERKPQTKLFRMGYADRRCKVDQWIHSRIEAYREMALTDGIQIPEFQIVGHTLSRKRATVQELVVAIKQLITAVESITDVTDINSDIGRACERADDVLART